MSTENVFRKALEGWDEDHWTKGASEKGIMLANGDFAVQRCAMGRVAMIVEANNDHMRSGMLIILYGRLNQVSTELFPDRVGTCVTFAIDPAARINDHPDTTFEDIVTIFEKCAVLEDESPYT